MQKNEHNAKAVALDALVSSIARLTEQGELQTSAVPGTARRRPEEGPSRGMQPSATKPAAAVGEE